MKHRQCNVKITDGDEHECGEQEGHEGDHVCIYVWQQGTMSKHFITTGEQKRCSYHWPRTAKEAAR